MAPPSPPSSCCFKKKEPKLSNGAGPYDAPNFKPIYGFEALEEENKNMSLHLGEDQRIRRKLDENSKRKNGVSAR